jgi:hypothetical protein
MATAAFSFVRDVGGCHRARARCRLDHANHNRCNEAESGNDADKPQLIGDSHATLLGG